MLRVHETKYGLAEITAYIACFLAPWIAVTLISSLVLGPDLVPEISQPTDAAFEAPVILDSLSSHLIGISVGVLVAAWFIFRQDIRSKGNRLQLSLALANTAMAFATIFVGLRFRYEVAIIINSAALDMELVSSALGWQSGFLLCQIGFFNVGAVHFFLNRDRRAKI